MSASRQARRWLRSVARLMAVVDARSLKLRASYQTTQSAGDANVYVNTSTGAMTERSELIAVVCGDFRWRAMLLNWAVALERASFRHYVIFAADERLSSFLNSLGAPTFHFSDGGGRRGDGAAGDDGDDGGTADHDHETGRGKRRRKGRDDRRRGHQRRRQLQSAAGFSFSGISEPDRFLVATPSDAHSRSNPDDFWAMSQLSGGSLESLNDRSQSPDAMLRKAIRWRRNGRLWWLRWRFIWEILRRGVDVIHSDIDAVWLKSPLPFLGYYNRNVRNGHPTEFSRQQQLMRDASLIASRGAPKPQWLLCMGWIMLRSSPAVLQVLF